MKRYKLIEGRKWIEIRVKNPLQLFDARDPAPFRERDLDEKFIEYIITAVQEFPISTPLKIVIYIEENISNQFTINSIKEAIQSYLEYQKDLQKRNLKNFIKKSQVFFIFGLAILFLCISITQSLPPNSPLGFIRILREGMIIFGWVSMWKPIELVLFDWYPIYEKVRLYKKILNTEFDIKFNT